MGDLGDLYKIRVGRDDSDQWTGWHLGEVTVQLLKILYKHVKLFIGFKHLKSLNFAVNAKKPA